MFALTLCWNPWLGFAWLRGVTLRKEREGQKDGNKKERYNKGDTELMSILYKMIKLKMCWKNRRRMAKRKKDGIKWETNRKEKSI